MGSYYGGGGGGEPYVEGLTVVVVVEVSFLLMALTWMAKDIYKVPVVERVRLSSHTPSSPHWLTLPSSATQI